MGSQYLLANNDSPKHIRVKFEYNLQWNNKKVREQRSGLKHCI